MFGQGNTHTTRHIQESSAKLKLGLFNLRAGGLWVFGGSASFSLNKDRDAYSSSFGVNMPCSDTEFMGPILRLGGPSDRRKGSAALHKNSKSRSLAEYSTSSDRKQAIKNRK